jgi:tetratricopeptide (TPR) repeat protein
MRIQLTLVLLFLFITTEASAYYEFNPRLQQAYTSVINLHFEEAKSLLDKEKLEKPKNDLVHLYDNYIDFLKAFISEEENDFKKFKLSAQERLKIINRNKENISSPFHSYSNAEIFLQLAMVKVKYREHVSAVTDIRKAYKLIEKNNSEFPEFMLNSKLQGFLHAMVGAVPKQYHWLVDMAGMEGSVEQGMEELQKLFEAISSSPYEVYKPEILFYLSNIYNSFSADPTSPLKVAVSIYPYTMKSQLMKYCFSNIMMKAGRNDDALDVLTSNEIPAGVYQFTFLRYKTGMAKLRNLDFSAAEDFKKFLSDFHGMNFIKSAWQKLAWIELLKGNTKGYHDYLSKVLTSGNLLVDEDKEAEVEATQNEAINLILLKARLLFDGGYYEKSRLEIAGKPVDSFPRYREQLEVTYRLARIMEKTGQNEKAIKYYEQTLKNGASASYYFAANSALMLGLIYEQQKNYLIAESYFKQCLSMDRHEYQNSIDQKAQAGLDRLKLLAESREE